MTANQSDKDRSLDEAKAFLLYAFDSACQRNDLQPDQAATLITALALHAARKAQLLGADELPASAPELWRERDLNRRENPIQFVRRVYASHLAKRMTRKHLRKIDPDLYRALTVWETRHPDQTVKELVKLKDSVDEGIAVLSAIFSPDELTRLATILQARYRRARTPKPQTS